MSEFLYLYRNGPSRPTPEQMQAQMERWRTWMAELESKGHLKDFGHPLERSGKLVTGNGKTITDGPFAEAKDVIGGYSIVTAKDAQHAAELAAGCPIFQTGGAVEVRPLMKM